MKMDTISMNSENSKTSEPYVLILKLTNKLDLRRVERSFALSNLSIYYPQKNIKSSYNNNKLKISSPAQNDKFKLPDGWYSVSDVQDSLEYTLKKHGENIENSSIKIYVNKIENRITFKVKNGYSLELLTPETMRLLGSTENKITKDKNGKNVPHLEITEVVLVQEFCIHLFQINHLGIYQKFPQTNHIFLKTFNSEFQTTEVWFTDQNSQPLEKEDRINLTLEIK